MQVIAKQYIGFLLVEPIRSSDASSGQLGVCCYRGRDCGSPGRFPLYSHRSHSHFSCSPCSLPHAVVDPRARARRQIAVGCIAVAFYFMSPPALPWEVQAFGFAPGSRCRLSPIFSSFGATIFISGFGFSSMKEWVMKKVALNATGSKKRHDVFDLCRRRRKAGVQGSGKVDLI